jgi:4-aminobutyrate aminotransferase
MEQLRELQRKHKLIYDVRGMGLLVAVVLQLPDGSPANDQAEQVMYRALSQGLSFKVSMGSTLVLTPPLTIEERHLDRAVKILDDCLSGIDAV